MLVTALISRPSYDIRYILSYFRNVRVVYLPLMLYIDASVGDLVMGSRGQKCL
jgi:hypothetical protein